MIQANAFLPELSHIDEHEKFPTFITTDGRIGCLFECAILDLEAIDTNNRNSALERLIQSLPDNLVLRVIHRAEGLSQLENENFRSQAINHLGYVSRKNIISIESYGADPISIGSVLDWIKKRKNSLSIEIEKFRRLLPEFELNQLGARALNSSQMQLEFLLPEDIVEKKRNFIDSGQKLSGVVRIYKPGTQPIHEGTLASVLDELPLPYEIVVTALKVPKHRADFRLRSQLARGQVTSQDPTSEARQAAAEKALTETSLHGASLYEIEWLAILSRNDEATLRSDLEKSRSILSGFGEAMIETIGSVPSFVASKVGSRIHFSFLEEDNAIPFYLPLYGFGEEKIQKINNRALLLHRLDGSLHSYDHFNLKFLSYNAIICGKTGSGKSVLANALSSALMQDPNVRMIKIDVGGSYKKECEALGGAEINFKLDSPSGINPFKILNSIESSNEAIEVISEFLATLIREENEKQIPKSLRAQIEENLKKYTVHLKSIKKSHPSIDDFLSFSEEFPRKKLLSRWAIGGIFENALKESNDTLIDNSIRYRYFNFENIQAASSRDFSEGVMAAVITMTNLEMLRMGDRSNGKGGERLVLFCDETKFFIEKFSQFFLLTAANFRKFGHGLIFMLQNIKNAEIRLPDGMIDRGLILNSPIRFFLQADTESDYLKEQFHFDDHHLNVVVTNPYRGREYREAVLQDDTGTRVVRLYLTDEEYWRMTSTKEDVDKFNKLRKSVPELSIEEAIRCLSISQGR